jgi:hypothetical protein
VADQRTLTKKRQMTKSANHGRDVSAKEIREAERILGFTIAEQKHHPSAVAADQSKLSHINTYGSLPEFYLDRPFTCRSCRKIEIWKAKDQKWYYEEAKGHIDAKAVECHACRVKKKSNQPLQRNASNLKSPARPG